MKAVGYFLLDAPPEGGPIPHPTDAERAFLSFCELQGFEPAASFTDPTTSPEGKRPQYQELLSYLKQPGKEFTVVVAQRLRDLGDRPKDIVQRIVELEELGTRVMVLEDSAGEPLAKALEKWSEEKRKDTAGELVKMGMRSKAIRGLGLGKPPFGYRIGLNHRFEIVPEEAAVVGLLYKLYVEGKLGIRLVARHLNERGIRTRSGRRWSVVSVRDILRNRSYLGTYSRFGVRVPGNHPPIVREELFRRAQQRLGNRRRPSGGAAPHFLLSGLLYCGYCGNRMIGVTRHQSWTRRSDGTKASGEYRYYQCSSRTNQSVCDYHTKRARVLEGQVLAELGGYLEGNKLSELLDRGDASAVDDSAAEAKKLTARLRALDRRLDRYLGQASSRTMSRQQFRTASRKIDQTRQEVQERLAALEESDASQSAKSSRVERLASALRRLSDEGEQIAASARKALLQEVVARVTAWDDRTEVKLKV
ncbi:MAG: recombinase family protein [Chloroflexi bacterium]|nr:recombinase family protein [Chloroflexota bacterium]